MNSANQVGKSMRQFSNVTNKSSRATGFVALSRSERRFPFRIISRLKCMSSTATCLAVDPRRRVAGATRCSTLQKTVESRNAPSRFSASVSIIARLVFHRRFEDLGFARFIEPKQNSACRARGMAGAIDRVIDG
jgi:hypothetical protein